MNNVCSLGGGGFRLTEDERKAKKMQSESFAKLQIINT